jgi:Zn-dependent peptidase ImmA (M78 family)
MIVSNTDLAREALDKSLEIREEAGVQFGVPLNVYDLCERLTPRVRVRFADYSMEGCYFRSNRPLIEVSALRPIGRRAFNTAHELGHHVFGHGSRIDELQEEDRPEPQNDSEEVLANAFARSLLMPRLGVRRAFSSRGWSIKSPTAEQLFVIACHFGVGYLTLVNHLAYGLKEINQSQATTLARVRLPAIRKSILGTTGSDRLWVADRQYAMATLDTEVGTTLLFPSGSCPEFPHLKHMTDLSTGAVFQAVRPGMTRVETDDGWAVLVRIARYEYSGWSTNRHLEMIGDDDE